MARSIDLRTFEEVFDQMFPCKEDGSDTYAVSRLRQYFRSREDLTAVHYGDHDLLSDLAEIFNELKHIYLAGPSKEEAEADQGDTFRKLAGDGA